MSLQFIAGPGGCGKSTYVYKKTIGESLKDRDRSFYVIVPEQYSMQAQGDLVRLHPDGCITNIDVLNFTRLSYRIFRETGFDSGPVLDDIGKVLVLEKLSGELSGRLSVLGSAVRKKGAVSLVKSLISELIQYRVEPEKLTELAGSGEISGHLKYKLADIRELYSAFLEYTKGRYITAEEMPGILSGRLEMSGFLKDADIVLDGFTGFVPAQMGVIEKMLRICRKVTVVLTMDTHGEAAKILRRERSTISNTDLFCMSGETALALMKMAWENGTEILPPVFLEEREKKSRDLSFLAAHIYRNGNRTFEGAAEHIRLTRCRDPQEEMNGIAAAIGHLVRTGGYRYRDIAVVAGDPGTYDDIAEEIFEECGIPCFIDRKKPVILNPAAEFIRSAIGMMTDGFSGRSVFRYLRCGMTDFTRDEVDLLENYVLACGIRGLKKYKEEWTKPVRNMDEAALEKINEIRSRFADSVAGYAEAMARRLSTVEEKTRALHALITDNHIQEKCEARSEAYEARGDIAGSREYAQIYRILIDDLDKMTGILGSERVSLKTYEQLTEAIFAERRLGLIPPGADRVTVGDIERTRLSGIRVLFLAGANDGLIPAPVNRTSLLSAHDRDRILKGQVRLAPNEREELVRQQFYMYLMLQKPEDMLYISWPDTGTAGGVLMPSPLIGMIGKLMNTKPCVREPGLLLATSAGREKMLADGFNKMRSGECENEFLELCAWYADSPAEKKIFETAKQAYASSAPKTDIGEAAGPELYGADVLFSATRLERFAGCAFAHFLKYGLRLNEREIFEWSALDRGSLMHLALQNYLELSKRSDFCWDPEQAREAFGAAFGSWSEKLLTDPAGAAEKDRLKALTEMTAWALAEQIRRGNFRPAAEELPYQIAGVRGVIDRLDICRENGVDHFRVIDYKTGTETLDLSKLIYGAKIQLPLYMMAAKDLAEKTGAAAEPAGIYYYNIKEPVIEVRAIGERPDEKALLRELRLTGLTRNDPEVLAMTDRELLPAAASDVVKVTLKKDRTCDAKSEAADAGDFDLIYRYTGRIVKEMRERILSGEAGIRPLADEKSRACAWCEFRSICRFDRSIPGYTERICEKRSRKEALAEIGRILSGG